ncbi:MAG: efflux RND transporter periplasmic adaptor subunit [bacterium]|nr:MAG: efflux RND transporter periplasmic adaptor subunit [bacterium]
MEQDLSALRIDPSARRKGGPNRKLVIISIIVLFVILAVLFIWQIRGRVATVQVATARGVSAAGAAVLNASGYVTPRRRATVSAKITGKIEEVLIEEGMAVEEGQVLARLDDSDAMATLRMARAEHGVAKARIEQLEVELTNARKTLTRITELHSKAHASQEELDNAETAVASLEAQLVHARSQVEAAERSVAVARRSVENCTVRAPFAGIVVSKDAQPGEMVSPVSAGGGYTRTGIATIVDMNSLEIEVDVNESYIARVVPGQRIEAVLDAYPEWRIPSSVLTVIPTADRQKATVKVRIVFDELDPRILPDMGVKVTFLEEPSDEETPTLSYIPSDAVREEDGTTVVYVLKNGRLERRAIRTGRIRGSDVEVLAGVRGGERVVIAKGKTLRDGQRVVTRE